MNTLEGELAISFKPESNHPESDWTQVAAADAEVDQPEVGQVEASNVILILFQSLRYTFCIS